MSDIRKTFAAIASKAPRKCEIDVDGKKLTVYFRHMRLPDYASVRGLSELPIDDRIGVMPKLIARFLCDENGAVIYDHENAADVAEIAALDLPTIGALTNALNDVNPEAKNSGGDTTSPN